jgi:hypothetical protein
VLFYRAALPLSSRTLTYVAQIIRQHRATIGSPLRREASTSRPCSCSPPCARATFADTGAGFGAGTATAWRYVNETVALLAARSPKLRRAPGDAKDAGYAYVVIDGGR